MIVTNLKQVRQAVEKAGKGIDKSAIRRSIRGQKFNKGFGKYEAIVGPTIIYGRAVELGGKYAPPSWKGTSAMAGFPYMNPAFQKFKVQVPMIIRKHLAVTK